MGKIIENRRGILDVRAEADAKKVLEDLQKAWHEFKAENDTRIKALESKGSVDALLVEKVEKINADISLLDSIKAQISNLEMAVSQGQFGTGGDPSVDKAKSEHAKAFERFFRKGVDAGLADLEVKASLRTSSDPDGGYTVPEEVEKTIDRVAETVSAMRRLATVMNISTDTYKKLVNMGGAGAGWVGETAARSETGTPTLKEIAINTKELYANPAATQTLLDDSAVNIANWLAGEVVIEFDEQEADAFIYGNGVEKPKGILGYTTVANASYAWGKIGYITSTHASTIPSADCLISLQHALKSRYRNGAAFLMADTTVEAIRKLKDTTNNYIWKPGIELGAPSTLLGKPVETDDNMPVIGANNMAIAYGNFKRAYMIIDRVGIRVLRDPYTNKPYVHFYTTKRVGGGIVMYEALKLLKVSA